MKVHCELINDLIFHVVYAVRKKMRGYGRAGSKIDKNNVTVLQFSCVISFAFYYSNVVLNGWLFEIVMAAGGGATKTTEKISRQNLSQQ